MDEVHRARYGGGQVMEFPCPLRAAMPPSEHTQVFTNSEVPLLFIFKGTFILFP